MIEYLIPNRNNSGCDYTFGVYEITDSYGIVWIEDKNTGRSITNSAEKVMQEIAIQLNVESLSIYDGVIYKDSEGIWDGLNPSHNFNSSLFIPIRATKFEDAIKFIIQQKLNP